MTDRDRVEHTKQQIRWRVGEIAQIAKRTIDPRQFFDAFLDGLVDCLAAKGGAIWTLDRAGDLQLEYEIHWRETHLAENQTNLRRHDMLLRNTLLGGEGVVVAPRFGEGGDDQPCNPTEFLLVLGVLKVDREPKGVAIRSGRILASGLAKVDQYPTGIVEIFQRPGAPSTTQRGYLKFLGQMCELANDYLRRSSRSH